MPICTRCSSRNEEGTRFCGNCGAPLSAVAIPNPPVGTGAPPPRSTVTARNVILPFLVLLLLGIIGAIWAFIVAGAGIPASTPTATTAEPAQATPNDSAAAPETPTRPTATTAEPAQPTPNDSAAAPETPTRPTATTAEPAQPTPNDSAAAPETPTRAFSVTSGDVTYYGTIASDVGVAVLGVRDAGPFLPGAFDELIKADGRFIIVRVSVSNRQNTAITMDTGLFEILDSSGNVYSASEKGLDVATSDNLFLEQINPGLTKTGLVVFDVPQALRLDTLRLKFRGGMTGDSAILPLKVVAVE